MAWIESHQTLRNHPKIIRAARALGVSRVTMYGHMHCLWWWAMDYAQDGDISAFDPEDIAEAAEWEGDAGAFIAALLESARIGDKPGLLEMIDGRLCIHDWYDYAGKLIDKRKADAARKRDERRRDQPPTPYGMPEDVRGTSDGHPMDVAGTQPNLTVPNQTVPSEEEMPPGSPDGMTPEKRAINNAYDACGLMMSKTHQTAHLETIQRYGLQAWQLGFAAAMGEGKHNNVKYVARCAETAHIAETRGGQHADNRRNGSGNNLGLRKKPGERPSIEPTAAERADWDKWHAEQAAAAGRTDLSAVPGNAVSGL